MNRLNLQLKKDGEKIISDIGYISCHVFGSYDGKYHVIIPTSGELNGNIESSSLANAEKRIDNVMNGTLPKITSF